MSILHLDTCFTRPCSRSTESTIFHEITHLHFFGTQTQENRGTYDRKFRIKNKDTGIYETYQAYGPEYTKILARWAEKDVGYYTRTNGKYSELLPQMISVVEREIVIYIIAC